MRVIRNLQDGCLAGAAQLVADFTRPVMAGSGVWIDWTRPWVQLLPANHSEHEPRSLQLVSSAVTLHDRIPVAWLATVINRNGWL